MKNPLTLALVAQVDAGKTTFVEQLLYQSGFLKTKGRVDHQDAFLDYDPIERKRGITISSKPVVIQNEDLYLQLLDTPGHAEFAADMERVLPVTDLALVIIDGNSPIHSHTQTIWNALRHYGIPAVFFINKTDMSTVDPKEVLQRMRDVFQEPLYAIEDPDEIEQIALLNEELLNEFLENETLSPQTLQALALSRTIIPVFWGSALQGEGISSVISFLKSLPEKSYPQDFGARVFAIENKGSERLSYARITGGNLAVRDEINGQKVNRLYIPQGEKLKAVNEASAGQIVAISGLEDTRMFGGLGFEKDRSSMLLSSFLQYQIRFEGDPLDYASLFETINQQNPGIHIEIAADKSVHVRLAGAIQKEVLKEKLDQAMGKPTYFTDSQIVYLETIKEPAIGIGHFEPLKHYAEVHVLLKPVSPSSGLRIVNDLRKDDLPLGFQSSIIKSLQSIAHKGLLAGADLTDMEIHLIAARASKAHSSQQDFEQAARRAVRNALTRTESVLLEPMVRFELVIGSEFLSRALHDLDLFQASYTIDSSSEPLRIKGSGPLRLLQNYSSTALSYSRGSASFTMRVEGYAPSRQQEQILDEIGYVWQDDTANPASSIFFAHGAGFSVDYDDVEEYAHIVYKEGSSGASTWRMSQVSDDQAKAIFEQAGGKNKKEKKNKPKKKTDFLLDETPVKIQKPKETLLIVDGYNMIYAWKELKELARSDLAAARERLIDHITNYAGYHGYLAKIVFDAYRTKESIPRSYKSGSIEVIYTHHNQNADQYIERITKDLSKSHSIVAATSDGLIQNSILSHGGLRLSARELERRVNQINKKAFSHLD